MRSSQPQAGYTIIEVMIFLIISAGIFGTAVVNISLQNQRTRFNEAVQTFDQRIQDVLNDVGTGYYPSNGGLTCTVSGGLPPAGGRPSISAGTNQQGTNQACTFIGKAIQVAPDTRTGAFNIFTLVGARTITVGGIVRETQSLEEAQPEPIEGGVAGMFDAGTLSGNLQISRVLYGNGGTYSTQGGGFAIVSGFGQSNIDAGPTGLQSGIVRMSLASVPGSSIGQPAGGFANSARNIATPNTLISGVLICIQETDGSRFASVLIGGQGQKTTTSVGFDTGARPECTP